MYEVDLITPPKWEPLSKSNFPAESVGNRFFPDQLEGRVRPVTIFHQPIAFLYRNHPHPGVQELNSSGLFTVSETLHTPICDLERFTNVASISQHIRDYLQRITESYHTTFFKKAYSWEEEEGSNLSLDDEETVKALIEERFLSLPPDRVLRAKLKLGLYDGVLRTYEEVGNLMGVSGIRIFHVEKRIYWDFRKINDPRLTPYLEKLGITNPRRW